MPVRNVNHRSRRDSLKTLLAGGSAILAGRIPEVWTRPVVEAIVLPVHAVTSSGCTAPPGCYLITGAQDEAGFSWSGGAGPESVLRKLNASPDCTLFLEGSDTFITYVVAGSPEEALVLLNCGGIAVLENTTPALRAGCNFYRCAVPG